MVACMMAGASAFTPSGILGRTRRPTSSILADRSVRSATNWAAAPRRRAATFQMQVAAETKTNYDEVGKICFLSFETDFNTPYNTDT